MGYRLTRLLNIAFLLIVLAGFVRAQIPSARAILEESETEQAKFVVETMAAGFPADRADQMTMLIINRSALLLPLLEERIEAELRSTSPSKDFIATASEMIAYAGDEHALRAISRLIAVDEKRFGSLVKRTLDNALDFRNPFSVAYRGYDFGDAVIARQIAGWSETTLSSIRMQRLLGDALVAKYGRVPDDSEWVNDPIAANLKRPQRQELKESVLRFAQEAKAKADQRQ